MPINRNILNLLDKQGMSQAELARLSGVSPVTISALVNGKRQPAARTLHKLAVVLGVEPEALLP